MPELMWASLRETSLRRTCNIVTISEHLARETGDPSLAIIPGLWLRKGTPVMLFTLVLCSLLLWLGYDYLYIETL